MDELVDRVSADAGIEPEVARKAVGLILAFLQKEGPTAEVGQVMDALPGSREVAAASAADEQAGSGFLGGLAGGGGLMGLAGQLSGIGLGMGDMTSVGKTLFTAAREKVGDETMGKIAAEIPGLAPFI